MQWHKDAVSWFGTGAQKEKAGSYPKSCSSALVFGDCKSVCSVDLHRCKCSGTKLLSAGLAQQHRRTRQAVNLNSCKCTGVW